MWNQAAITDAGLAVLAAAAAGATLVLDSAASGAGTVPVNELAGCTDVATRKATLSIVKTKASGSGIKVDVMVTCGESAYQAKQIGIFGHTGSDSPVLLAIYQDADGIAVPSNEMPDFAFLFSAWIAIDNATEVEITADPSALVSQSQLEDTAEEILDAVKCKKTIVTLQANGGWTYSSPYYLQSVSVTGLTASRFLAAAPADEESWDTAAKVTLYPPTAGNGSLTFKSKKLPSSAINVEVLMQ